MSLQKLKSLDARCQRAAAAILGSMVADAAAAPLHWIYDQDKVAQLVKDNGGCPVFYPTSQCPYYVIPTGNNSTYGDQLYVSLKSMVDNKGFDAKKLADAIFSHFGPGTEYEKVRQQTCSPKQGPWTNHNLKTMIANREKGVTPEADADSKDPDGLCKAIALVTQPDASIKPCVNTAQSNPVAVDFAEGGIHIVKKIIESGELQKDKLTEGLKPQVAAAVELAMKNKDPHTVAAKAMGLACSFPGSFSVAVHGIVNNSSSYAHAVEEEIKAGGDNCSRIMFVGACCGALRGLDSIPEDWLKKYNKSEEVIGLIEAVMAL